MTEAYAYAYVYMQVPAVSSKVYLESCQKAAQTLASAVLGPSGPCLCALADRFLLFDRSFTGRLSSDACCLMPFASSFLPSPPVRFARALTLLLDT